jgi:hypothetical protein
MTTPVLARYEPPNQTGEKMTLWYQIVAQLRLWVLWGTDGDIQPFPTLAKHFKWVLKHFKKCAIMISRLGNILVWSVCIKVHICTTVDHVMKVLLIDMSNFFSFP